MTDAAGQRTFSYTGDMQLDAETLNSSFYGDKVLTNKYEASSGTVTGRDKGFKLGTSSDPDADMEVTYGYGTKGRFDSVTDSNSPMGTCRRISLLSCTLHYTTAG